MNAETDMARVHLLATARNPARPVELDQALLERNLVTGFGPRNDQNQPFFAMRANLLAHAKASGQQVFAVTSVEPGNGKTHIAVNLAAVLSRITPTVLIGLDLHRPSVGRRLGLADETAGIDDYLAEEADWPETRIAIEGFDLAVHRVRRARANPESLLGNGRLASAIGRLRETASRPICLIDTPPAIICDDLALITRVVDGFLVVAEEARSRKRGLQQLHGSLGSTPIIATVLNKSLSDGLRSNGYGYGYGGRGKAYDTSD